MNHTFVNQGDIIGVFLQGGPANYLDWLNEGDGFVTETTEGYDVGVDLSVGGPGAGNPGTFVVVDEEIRMNNINPLRKWLRLTVQRFSLGVFSGVDFEGMSDEKDRIFFDNESCVFAAGSFTNLEFRTKNASGVTNATFTDVDIELFDDLPVQTATNWSMDAATTVRNLDSGTITLQHTGAPPNIHPTSGPITLQQL